MSSYHTGNALVEGRYWDNTNVSYKGVFDLIADLHGGSTNKFHYETGNSRAAIEEIIRRLSKKKSIKYLCLAGHGEPGNIVTINKDCVSCSDIAEWAMAGAADPSFIGIHFSTCNTINLQTAKSMLKILPARKWVSGYRKQAQFMEASALDMLFFDYLIESSKSRPSNVIKEATARLCKNCEHLVKHLGFGVFTTNPETNIVESLCPA